MADDLEVTVLVTSVYRRLANEHLLRARTIAETLARYPDFFSEAAVTRLTEEARESLQVGQILNQEAQERMAGIM